MSTPLRPWHLVVAGVLLVALGCADPLVPVEEEPPPPDPGMVLDAGPGSAFPSFGWTAGSRALVGLVTRGPSKGAPIFILDLASFNLRHVDVGQGWHAALHVATETDAIYLIGQDYQEPSYLKRVPGAGEGSPEVVADSLSAQEFLVSPNDRWVAVRSGRSWHVIERVTSSRRVIADTTLLHPRALSDDGQFVAFTSPCATGECLFVADAATAGVRAVPRPHPLATIIDVVFAGGSLRVVSARTQGSSRDGPIVLEEWTDRTNEVSRVGTTPQWPDVCIAWSRERRVAVGMVFESERGWPRISRVRIEAITSAGSQTIGSVDLKGHRYANNCQLSPDGKWFLYGDTNGYHGGGTLYLKPVPGENITMSPG